MTANSRRLLASVIGLLVAVAAGVVLSTGGVGAALSGPAASPSGPSAPTQAFAMFDGRQATLADYEGRPLVVNFWASWCPSCVAEMSAAFRPAQEQLGDRVAFLGMNIQDDRQTALRLVDETGVLFDLAEDPAGDLYQDLGGLGMPFTVFISADGRIVDRHNGPLTEGQLLDRLGELFGVV